MSFRVGQKVIRIGNVQRRMSGRFVGKGCTFSYPEIGDVVTIRTINEWPEGTILTFYEHDNSDLQRRLGERWEPGFGAEHFRPIVQRETDISIFKKLLEPSRKTQKELQ